MAHGLLGCLGMAHGLDEALPSGGVGRYSHSALLKARYSKEQMTAMTIRTRG